MHILILKQHALQAQFVQRALRYESIGADIVDPRNADQIWYGQYDAIIAPTAQWNLDEFTKIQEKQQRLGGIPILFTSRLFPPPEIEAEIQNNPTLDFMGTHHPFHQICEELRTLVKENQNQKVLGGNADNLVIADIHIDPRTHQVERKRKKIQLRNREFALLMCFAQNANRILTRTFLLENVWDRNTSILSNTVDVHISRLRRKIDDGFRKKRILTIPCVGYKLIG